MKFTFHDIKEIVSMIVTAYGCVIWLVLAVLMLLTGWAWLVPYLIIKKIVERRKDNAVD